MSVTESLALEVSDFTFSHLGKSEGLANQRIFSLCKTKDGAIWWSSKTGIGRFNGSEVKNFSLSEGTPYVHLGARVIKLMVAESPFTQHPSPNTQSDRIIAYDSRSYLFEFNHVQGRFVPYGPKKLAHEGLNDICNSDGKMYLAMYDGVFRLQDNKLIPVMRGAYVNKIVSMKNRLLFCAREGVYDERGHRLLPYNVESGYYDELTGMLWLGGYENGLILATVDKAGNLQHPPTPHRSTLTSQLSPLTSHLPIRCICPFDDETMLIGIDGLGVYQMRRDGSGQPSLLFDANESQNGVLHGNGIYSMLVDQWNNIVIGTYSGGIDIARPIGSTTAIYKHIPNERQSLLNDHVNAVLPLSQHLLIMGTDNGVSILNTETNTWQHCCQGTVVLGLCKRPDGNVLVSTYGKGIYEILITGGSTVSNTGFQASAQQVYTTKGGQLKDDHVYALCYDRDGNLWIGCLNGQLVQMDTNGNCHYYPVNNVQTIVQLPSGQIAVGTAFGLKIVTPVPPHQASTESLSKSVEDLNYAPVGTSDINIFVNHLLLNSHELWIATEGGGVYIWHLLEKKGRQLTTDNGLPSNHVCSLVRGRDGRIWIATEEGLAFISPDRTSPGDEGKHVSEQEKVYNVNYCYGLNREYSHGAAYSLPGGDVLLGSTTGAVIIHPENVQAINYKARLTILGISCKSHEQEQFREDVQRMLAHNKLNLKYSQRTFDLLYESVNMRNHFDIAYRYKIDNGEWSQPTDQQYIRFVSMESGSHLLTLQCISQTSGTVIDTLTLTITIAQPWWNSWWMWCVYIALVVLAFYGAWRVYKLQEKYMRLTIDYLQLSQQDEQDETSRNNNFMTPKSVLSSEVLSSVDAKEQKHTEPQIEENNGGKEFVDKATRLIVENLSDSEFTIDRLCREMAMSRTLFYVKLKSYTGKSPQDFIRIIRLERAATLLRNGRSVTDVAALAGFDNPKYFSTVFKKYFGVSPSKYQ